MDDDLTLDHMIELLEDVKGNVDYENCTTLVDDNILDSFAIISLVTALEDEFGIMISPAELVPENFNSANALWEMIERLMEA